MVVGQICRHRVFVRNVVLFVIFQVRPQNAIVGIAVQSNLRRLNFLSGFASSLVADNAALLRSGQISLDLSTRSLIRLSLQNCHLLFWNTYLPNCLLLVSRLRSVLRDFWRLDVWCSHWDVDGPSLQTHVHHSDFLFMRLYHGFAVLVLQIHVTEVAWQPVGSRSWSEVSESKISSFAVPERRRKYCVELAREVVSVRSFAELLVSSRSWTDRCSLRQQSRGLAPSLCF